MSHVNMVSIIRDLPSSQIVRKTFEELEEAGLPSSVSELRCPVPYTDIHGRQAIDLSNLSPAKNVTQEAVDSFSKREGGVDLENTVIDGRYISDGSLEIKKGQFSNTTLLNLDRLTIEDSDTLPLNPLDPKQIGLHVGNVSDFYLHGGDNSMNHLTAPIELNNVTKTHANNLHFGDIEATDSPIKLKDSIGFRVTSNRPNVTLIPPLGPESTVRDVFIRNQK